MSLLEVEDIEVRFGGVVAVNGASFHVDEGTVVSFRAPTVPGRYEFYCDIHPSMTGSLVVD